MIKLCIAATLPLVAVTTRDFMNLHDVINELTGVMPEMYDPNKPVKGGDNKVYMWLWSDKMKLPWIATYEKMVAAESTLIVVNCEKLEEPMFDAGEVPIPKKLLHNFMNAVVEDEAKATELVRGLGGCTLKETAEFARLTMARDSSLTLPGVMETRKTSFQGQSGLTPVDSAQTFYQPPPELVTWMEDEKNFFLYGTDPRLIPRGLLMDGPPGTGKTAAAKFIAEKFGVPLYRVDIGGTKSKYVGESEGQMLANLSRIDQEEPCVALLDEIEKVFGISNNDVSGTTSTMLSQLLWWLAERRSRVLVIMTTNNAKALPTELHREGRIDQTMWFGGLETGAAKSFVVAVLKTFTTAKFWEENDAVEKIVKDAFAASAIPNTNPPRVSQAALTVATYGFVKEKTKNSLPIPPQPAE